MTLDNPSFTVALVAGGAAGTVVDIVLFPLDTIKTRLQSSQGFLKSGGFRNIYSGLASTALGSAPTAALFFCTYEVVKKISKIIVPEKYIPLVYMTAASCGEVVACLIRVPVEVVKQRTQANSKLNSYDIFKKTIQSESFSGLYRGYFSTVIREIPFSLIQFPLWEMFKTFWSEYQGHYVQPWQASACGALAGAIAAGLTTPLDMAKTRIILAEKGSVHSEGHVLIVLKSVWKTKGLKGLFAGLLPRISWIALGGCIFFGVYEKIKYVILNDFKHAVNDPK